VKRAVHIGKIYQDDRTICRRRRPLSEEFLKKFPAHQLASDAKDALAEIGGRAEPNPKKRKKELAKERNHRREKDRVPEAEPDDEPMGKAPKSRSHRLRSAAAAKGPLR